MVFADYLLFENPNVLVFVVGVLLFVFLSYVMKKFFRNENKGVAIIVAFVVSIIASWRLYIERFYGWEGTLIVVIYVLFGALILKMLWGFMRGSKRYFFRS